MAIWCDSIILARKTRSETEARQNSCGTGIANTQREFDVYVQYRMHGTLEEQMIEIRDLNDREIHKFIDSKTYGHLGCCDQGQPYVVPVHFAFKDDYFFIYTTQGKKTEIISRNPRVCLQIEAVEANTDWTSVIVFGEAQELVDESERSAAIAAVAKVNPTLTPAVSIHWMDNWVRENIEVIYRLVPLEMTGRASVPKSETPAQFISSKLNKGTDH